MLAHFTKVETALFDITRMLRPGVSVARRGATASTRHGCLAGLVESVVPREMLAPAYAEAAPWHERFKSRTASRKP